MGVSGIKAVFLDRDGVINPLCGNDALGNPESPLTLSEFQIFHYVGWAVRALNQTGYLVFVATNQPAYAKGKMELEELRKMHSTLKSEIEKVGGRLEKIYVCLHHPDPDQVVRESLLCECECRKPKPGMLLEAAKEFGIDMEKSWMVGDSWKDVIAGNRAGCKTILIAPERKKLLRCRPNHSTVDLTQAVEIIQKEERNG